MSTKRRSPLVRNSTRPSRVAKIVSSRPIFAPGPGRKRVPRWRTMIIPALTSWPSNILTPSIFGFESRPLREEPRPFLCAIVLLRLLGGGRLCLRLRRRRLLRSRLRLVLRGSFRLLRRSALLRSDRLDLDLRQLAPVARMAAVAGATAVLPDHDLVAEHVADDAHGHRAVLRREIGVAVAAEHEDARLEGLALGHAEALDQQLLALLDAVLLPSD